MSFSTQHRSRASPLFAVAISNLHGLHEAQAASSTIYQQVGTACLYCLPASNDDGDPPTLKRAGGGRSTRFLSKGTRGVLLRRSGGAFAAPERKGS
jgi:hypothetical protein